MNIAPYSRKKTQLYPFCLSITMKNYEISTGILRIILSLRWIISCRMKRLNTEIWAIRIVPMELHYFTSVKRLRWTSSIPEWYHMTTVTWGNNVPGNGSYKLQSKIIFPLYCFDGEMNVWLICTSINKFINMHTYQISTIDKLSKENIENVCKGWNKCDCHTPWSFQTPGCNGQMI